MLEIVVSWGIWYGLTGGCDEAVEVAHRRVVD